MRKLYAAIILCCLGAGTAQAAAGGSFMDLLREYFGLHGQATSTATNTVPQTGRTGGRTANATTDVPPCNCYLSPEGKPICPDPPPGPDPRDRQPIQY